jgi:hypothetical protein
MEKSLQDWSIADHDDAERHQHDKDGELAERA